MADSEYRETKAVADAFRKTLDRHGYGFQYAAIREARRLFEIGQTSWRHVATEFPVEVNNHSTRIDFILNQPGRSAHYVMVVECKRANPALSNWCFAYASEDRMNVLWPELIPKSPRVATMNRTKWVYDLAIEVKAPLKGDVGGSGRGAIEDAVTKALRGLNGLVVLAKTDSGVLSIYGRSGSSSFGEWNA